MAPVLLSTAAAAATAGSRLLARRKLPGGTVVGLFWGGACGICVLLLAVVLSYEHRKKYRHLSRGKYWYCSRYLRDACYFVLLVLFFWIIIPYKVYGGHRERKRQAADRERLYARFAANRAATAPAPAPAAVARQQPPPLRVSTMPLDRVELANETGLGDPDDDPGALRQQPAETEAADAVDAPPPPPPPAYGEEGAPAPAYTESTPAAAAPPDAPPDAAPDACDTEVPAPADPPPYTDPAAVGRGA